IMDAGTLVGLLIAAGAAFAVYQDALSRGWDSGSAILIAIGVFILLIIFLPVYLFTKNNPGRRKVTLAANRSIAKQTGERAKDIVIDSMEIAREVGMSKPEIVRELLYQSVARGELPLGVKII
ncbi:MAG: hypothetical protein ACKPB9_30705, partial [Dolichospermum sp.]